MALKTVCSKVVYKKSNGRIRMAWFWPKKLQKILSLHLPLNLVVEHYCETSSGTLVEWIHMNARWIYSKICSIFICFQVSKIVGCKMERQTELNFDFKEGACSTFNEPDSMILLCFDWDNNKECHTWVYLFLQLFYLLFQIRRRSLSNSWFICILSWVDIRIGQL